MAPSQLRCLVIYFVGLYGMCWQDSVDYVLGKSALFYRSSLDTRGMAYMITSPLCMTKP